MATQGPTDTLGPHVDIFCIMMNHLRPDTVEKARARGAELWCYSCEDLNNPALTIHNAPIKLRLWHWLQEKWGVQRTLVWGANVYAANYQSPGADGKGDGHLVWEGRFAGELQWYPSIRLAMMRDGVEDRLYFDVLRAALSRAQQQGASAELIAQAQDLLEVPASLAADQFHGLSRDPQAVLTRRAQIADMIEQLQRVSG